MRLPTRKTRCINPRIPEDLATWIRRNPDKVSNYCQIDISNTVTSRKELDDPAAQARRYTYGDAPLSGAITPPIHRLSTNASFACEIIKPLTRNRKGAVMKFKAVENRAGAAFPAHSVHVFACLARLNGERWHGSYDVSNHVVAAQFTGSVEPSVINHHSIFSHRGNYSGLTFQLRPTNDEKQRNPQIHLRYNLKKKMRQRSTTHCCGLKRLANMTHFLESTNTFIGPYIRPV